MLVVTCATIIRESNVLICQRSSTMNLPLKWEFPGGYINQETLNKNILLFVRESKRDEWGNTLGYVFLGDARFEKHEGEKPMSITWELREPIPSYLWNASAKMAVG